MTHDAYDPSSTNDPRQRPKRALSALLLAALLCLTAIAASAQSAATAPPEIAQVEAPRIPGDPGDAGKSLEELMAEHTTPALSVAVVKGYEIVWAKAYGMADVEAGRAADTNTLFQAASISKPVSAMAVLRAIQDGHFGLDDDIDSILESWSVNAKEEKFLEKTKVTPRLLLSMKAGTTVHGFPGYSTDAEIPSVVQVLGDGGKKPVAPANTPPVVVGWEPGTKEQYSGGGSTILQLALMDALDRPFEETLQTWVLGPLGMTRSCFCQPLPAELEGNAARAYILKGEAHPDHPRWHVYPELYAAGLWTTATDLARFMIEVQKSLEGRSNRVLDQEMVRKMVTPGGIGPYALGFSVGSQSPHRAAPPGEASRFFGHTGGNWGFRGNFDAHLEGGNGFVILANSGSSNPILFGELPQRIRAAYGWDD